MNIQFVTRYLATLVLAPLLWSSVVASEQQLDDLHCRHRCKKKEIDTCAYSLFTALTPPTTPIVWNTGDKIAFPLENINHNLTVSNDFKTFTVQHTGTYNILVGISTELVTTMVPDSCVGIYLNEQLLTSTVTGTDDVLQSSLNLTTVDITLNAGDVLSVRVVSVSPIEWQPNVGYPNGVVAAYFGIEKIAS